MASETPLSGTFLCETPQDTQKYYDDWAKNYDTDVVTHRYNAPKYLMDIMPNYVALDNLILAVGAGTGTEAVLMKERGYKHIHDVHDGSEEMLKLAKQKGGFEKYMCELLIPGERSQFESAHYDAMICIGCFVKGALDERHVEDLMRTLKQGGISIIATREIFVTNPGSAFDYPYDLEKKFGQLEKDGKLKLLERRRLENYSEGGPGVFYVHKKL